MKQLLLYGLLALLLTACSKKNSKPEPEQNIVFDINTSSAVIHSNSSYSFQVTLKSKMPVSGIKVEVSAVQEVAGTAVSPQPAAITSTTSATTASVQNLPQQKWVVATVRVSSATTATNTATQTFRVIYK
jgi:uncharacterized protein YcfL